MLSRIALVVYAGTFEKKGDAYRLGHDTAGRCRKALKIARRTRRPVIFLSGGEQPGNSETTHARVMFEWFRDKGFGGDIVASTTEVITNSAIETAIAARRIEQYGPFYRVVAVTSWYHMPRVWFLWRLLTDRRPYSSWSGETKNWWWSLLWEVGGFGKLFLQLIFRKGPFNKPVPA